MDKNIEKDIIASIKYIELCAYHQGFFYQATNKKNTSYDKLQKYINDEYENIKKLLKRSKNK